MERTMEIKYWRYGNRFMTYICELCISIFREEDASAFAGWDLEMLVFVEGGKPENSDKNPLSEARTNTEKLDPLTALCQNRIRVTLVGGKNIHHCATIYIVDYVKHGKSQ